MLSLDEVPTLAPLKEVEESRGQRGVREKVMRSLLPSRVGETSLLWAEIPTRSLVFPVICLNVTGVFD